MLIKLKNSFLVLVLALSMIGCVDQSGKSDNNNLTIAATSVAVTEILEALENINRSFQVLFDQLLEDDLLDVSTDISALKAMLAQEGLSGNGLFDKQDGNKS